MMDIETIIKNGENEKVEFKSSFKNDTIESIVAFANTKGGEILIGIDDVKNIVGVHLGKESIQNYINQIKQNTRPSIMIDIVQVSLEDKVLLYIKVDEFPIKPVSCRDKFYKRVQNSNHIMDLTEISNMHLQSLQLSWDAYESNNITIDDLDDIKIKKFIKKVNENERFLLSEDTNEALTKLNFIKESKPTHAAMLLFSKEQNIYNIHIGRFKTASHIIDDKMIKETLYEAVELCMKYIISWIKVAFEFTGEIQRTEIFEYPLKALRELILNAIIHRNYTSPIDTQIKIFDKAITIFNPGKLYGDMTIEKLKTDTYQAQTRNKLIAEAFYLTNDIEKYSSGYIRVRKEIADYPTMKFDYEEMGNGYLVTVSYDKQKTDSKIDGGVNDVYNYIKNSPSSKASIISKSLNIPQRTVERYVKELREKDMIEFKGSPKTGGYFAK